MPIPNMNQRLDELMAQMREMEIPLNELEKMIERYENDQTVSGVLVHTAATLLAVSLILGSVPEPTKEIA